MLHCFIFSSFFWVGWGGDDTTHAFCFIGFSFTLDAALVSSGWGWVGRDGDDTTHVFFFATGLSFTLDATLPDLKLALMPAICYAAWSQLALDATPLHPVLFLLGGVGWGGAGVILHMSFCFAGFAFTLDATLPDLKLALMLRHLLRCLILACPRCYAASSCLVSSGWGWVGWGGGDTTHAFCFIGFSFTLDAALVSSGWGWVGRGGDDTTHVFFFATGLSFTLDATLPDLKLALMPAICYAAWSQLALDATPLHPVLFLLGGVGWGGAGVILHMSFCFAGFAFTLDATLPDLKLALMLRHLLRCLILACPRCYAASSCLVSSGWGWVGWGGDDTTHVFCFAGFSFTLDATLLDLLLFLLGGVGWGGVGMILYMFFPSLLDFLLYLMLRYWWGQKDCRGVSQYCQ